LTLTPDACPVVVTRSTLAWLPSARCLPPFQLVPSLAARVSRSAWLLCGLAGSSAIIIIVNNAVEWRGYPRLQSGHVQNRCPFPQGMQYMPIYYHVSTVPHPPGFVIPHGRFGSLFTNRPATVEDGFVMTWEAVLETARRLVAPTAPSRLNCLFACDTLSSGQDVPVKLQESGHHFES
jgi:hypothetical protein